MKTWYEKNNQEKAQLLRSAFSNGVEFYKNHYTINGQELSTEEINDICDTVDEILEWKFGEPEKLESETYCNENSVLSEEDTPKAELTRQIETEYRLFRKEMLSKRNVEIYESSSKIRFYQYVYEYFLYAETLIEERIVACLECDTVIANMYDLYVKYEHLKYDKWDDIEEILTVFCMEKYKKLMKN